MVGAPERPVKAGVHSHLACLSQENRYCVLRLLRLKDLSTGSAQILLSLKIYYPERMLQERKPDIKSNPENTEQVVILSLVVALSK